MRITEDVMNDLLTLQLSGEASADTRSLIESYARENPAFAAKLAAAARPPALDEAAGGLPFDRELRVLAETRQFIFLRTICFAAAVLFTLVPFTFTWGSAGVHFLLLGHFPGLVWSAWSLAVASWWAVWVMSRRIRRVGL
jgi:hypothetical protein